MVIKEEILKDLHNDLIFEEDIVDKLADFYRALGWKSLVSIETQNLIKDGLAVLKKDSEKHAGMIKDMIAYIQKAGKDEF